MMSSLTLKLGLLAAAVVAATVFATAIYSSIRQEGVRAEAARVNAQNQEAGNAADQARSNFDAGCPAGLRFRSATGKCERPSLSGGG